MAEEMAEEEAEEEAECPTWTCARIPIRGGEPGLCEFGACGTHRVEHHRDARFGIQSDRQLWQLWTCGA